MTTSGPPWSCSSRGRRDGAGKTTFVDAVTGFVPAGRSWPASPARWSAPRTSSCLDEPAAGLAGYSGVPAVRDVDLELAAGEVLALLGPNGAGKTTVLLTAVGLLTPCPTRAASSTASRWRRTSPWHGAAANGSTTGPAARGDRRLLRRLTGAVTGRPDVPVAG